MAKKSWKIKVIVANRPYPVNVKTTDEERAIRESAKILNQLILHYQKEYENNIQDTLAMSCLVFVKEYVVGYDQSTEALKDLQGRIVRMQDKIQDVHLDK